MAIARESLPHKNIALLLTPSLISGWCCVVFSGLVVGVLIALAHLHNSELLKFASSWQSNLQNYSYLPVFQQAAGNSQLQSIAATLSTFLFWLVIGSIIYFLVYAVFDVIYAVREAKKEIHYVHVRKRQFVATILERTGIRLLALILLLLCVSVLMRHVVPTLLEATQHTTKTLQTGGRLLLAWGELAVTFHVGTVLIRLLALRTRF
jgi:hypothetical protein